MTAICKVWIKLILEGKRTIDDVPEPWRDEVVRELIAGGGNR